METGSELSKTVATFIVQKILLDDLGLQYICHTYERFSHVALILVSLVVWLYAALTGGVQGKMVHGLAKMQSSRLLKHVVRCYLRLTDNSRFALTTSTYERTYTSNRAREALRQCLPEPLRDGTFSACLKDDPATKRWLMQLLSNLTDQMAMGMHMQQGQSLSGPMGPM